MAVEIERKFLVRGEAWRSLATSEARIRQAYLASGERSTTRVRIKNDADATVTIKSKRAELRRLEVEYPISVLDAEALLSLRHSGLIEKTRFIVPWREHMWEVDVLGATMPVSSSPRSSCTMKTKDLSVRLGSASKSPGSRNTTTARSRGILSATGHRHKLNPPPVDLSECAQRPFSAGQGRPHACTTANLH
jgi:CYTH domain-containing protein